MQNLKKNWLVVWKMTRGIWQIFIRIFESIKIGTFMGSFCPKEKMHKLKMYRGVMCNDTEERWKIWRGIDLSFQNWHKQFDEFWFEHWKVSKIYILMGCFSLKYIMFELKRYRGVIFHDSREWCKIWRKSDLEMTWRIWQIFNRGHESLKIGTIIGFFLFKVENVRA